MTTMTMSPSYTEALWREARRGGANPDSFELALSEGGPAAVLARFGPTADPERAAGKKWYKNTDGLDVHGKVLETRAGDLDPHFTANERFFVCNEVDTPLVTMDNYRLVIEGDAVERPITLTYDDIIALPSHTVPAYLECAGNLRTLFTKLKGQPMDGSQWTLGAVGMATWTGVPLRTVLKMAGLRPNAHHVNVKGLDTAAPEGGVSRPMPLEKALDDDTLLAYLMNGEILPPDHGFPLRALVPGWIGSNSIKWLGQITVTSEPVWVERTTTKYVMVGDRWAQDKYGPADGEPLTTQNIKSSLLLPWPAELEAGEQEIRGIARSPEAAISKVEWSADDGRTWNTAALQVAPERYGLSHFSFNWTADPGEYSLMTRATDEAGNTQPDEVTENELGYLFNAVYPHPANVT